MSLPEPSKVSDRIDQAIDNALAERRPLVGMLPVLLAATIALWLWQRVKHRPYSATAAGE